MRLCGLLSRRRLRRLSRRSRLEYLPICSLLLYYLALNTRLSIVDDLKNTSRNTLKYGASYNKRLNDVFPRPWPSNYFISSCRCLYLSRRPEGTALETSSVFGYSAHIHYQLWKRGHVLPGSDSILAVQRSRHIATPPPFSTVVWRKRRLWLAASRCRWAYVITQKK